MKALWERHRVSRARPARIYHLAISWEVAAFYEGCELHTYDNEKVIVFDKATWSMACEAFAGSRPTRPDIKTIKYWRYSIHEPRLQDLLCSVCQSYKFFLDKKLLFQGKR